MTIPGTQAFGPLQTYSLSAQTQVQLPSNAIGATIVNPGPNSLTVSQNGSLIADIPPGQFSFLATGLITVSGQGGSFQIVPLGTQLSTGAKVIAHNNLNYSIQNSNQTAVTGITAPLQRTAIWFPAGASEIQVVYAGQILQQSDAGDAATGGGNLVIQDAIEYPAGTIYPITWNNGQPTFTMVSGAQEMKSDVLTIKIPPGAQAWHRSRFPNVTSGNYLPSNFLILGKNDPTGTPIVSEGFLNSSATISDTVANSIAGSFEPVAIIGKPLGTPVPAVITVGDSINHGTRDQFCGNRNYQNVSPIGWINDLLFNKAPVTNVSLSGYHAATYYSNFLRDSVSKYHDVFIWALGTNDFQGSTLAQLIQYASDAFLRAKSKGLTVVADTIKPDTVLSTSYLPLIQGQGGTQTIGNAAAETIRLAYNNWLRSSPPNLDFLIDSAREVDPHDTGLWPTCPVLYSGTAATVTLSGDGSYATIADSGLSAFATDSLANPSDGFGGYVVIFTSGTNAGTAGVAYSNTGGSMIINGFNDSYGSFNGTTFPTPLLTTAINESYIIADVATKEGLHPTPRYHGRVKAAARPILSTIVGVSL